MTESGFFKLGAIALALAVGLSACDQELPGSYPNSEALLGKITIAGQDVETLPVPISSEKWRKPGNLNLEDNQTVPVILDINTELRSVLVNTFPSKNAKVALAVGTNLIKPKEDEDENEFYDSNIVDLRNNSVVYVRVISEDKKTTNYYRFETKIFDPVPTISSIKFSDNEPITDFNNNNSSTINWNTIVSSVRVSLSSGGHETNVQVVPSVAAVIQYAQVKKSSVRDPVFESIDEDADTFTCDFDNGDVLYIKLTTEDGKNPRWYKFLISTIDLSVPSNAITFDPAKIFTQRTQSGGKEN